MKITQKNIKMVSDVTVLSPCLDVTRFHPNKTICFPVEVFSTYGPYQKRLFCSEFGTTTNWISCYSEYRIIQLFDE